MRTWMITWKPSEWPELPQRGETLRQGGEFVESWKFAFRNDQPQKGDRVFLKRTQDNGEPSGDWPNGIVAAGHIDKDGIYDVGDPGEAPTPHALIRFDWVQEDLSDVLPIQSLKDAFPDFKNWEPRNSGSAVTVDAYELELMWAKKIGVANDIMNILRASAEIDPFSHDPSYELIQKAVSLYDGRDPSTLTFADLDFIYMTVHIRKGETRRGDIAATSLGQETKSDMEALLDKCLDDFDRGNYTNGEKMPGLFRPGFQKFDRPDRNGKDICDRDLPSKLIPLLVKVLNAETPAEAFDLISGSGIEKWNGIAPASLSEMLHCMRPSDFPIWNGNEGLPPIWPLIMPGQSKPKTAIEYVEFARRAFDLKSMEFPFANFRVIDLAQRLLTPEGAPVPTWIVFQASENYPKERSGGYITSSLIGKGGNMPWHWKTMSEAEPGDLVFHMSAQRIRAISVVKGKVRDDGSSQFVDCEYHDLGTPVDAMKFRDLIVKEGQGKKRYPFNKNGGGNQIYFTGLPANVARAFAEDAVKNNPGMDASFLDPLLKGTKPAAGQGQQTQGGAIMPSEKKIGLNTILYGPPGTGKTYNAIIWAVAICEQGSKTLADVEAEAAADYAAVKARYDQYLKDGRIAFTTFHQSYAYEDFIEGIKPKTIDNAGKKEVVYPTLPGSFRRFCEKAKPAEGEEPRPCVFIIDEINRGNISKIFGELITLIEPSKREGAPEAMSAKLPYSGKDFSVPSNVYILGTMNTADRSIALMDTALRRRFQFVEMMPNAQILRDVGCDKVSFNGKEFDVAAALEAINRRIEVLYDREHTLGHALFMGLKDERTLEKLASIFRDSIIPLLQEYFYEDYEKIQLVLGDNAKPDNLKFVRDIENKPAEVFRGNSGDQDIPEKRYEIQESAFYAIESYIEIVG